MACTRTVHKQYIVLYSYRHIVYCTRKLLLAALVVVHSPGPNSPLAWVEHCVAELLSVRDARTRELVARKLLVGVPFYGYDMLPGDFKPILVSRFVFVSAAAARLAFTN